MKRVIIQQKVIIMVHTMREFQICRYTKSYLFLQSNKNS